MSFYQGFALPLQKFKSSGNFKERKKENSKQTQHTQLSKTGSLELSVFWWHILHT